MGRLPSPPDERDYLMTDAMAVLERLPRPVKLWHSDRVLDQLLTPHCVGFAWAGWGIADPVEDLWTDCMGHSIYRECKVLDKEAGQENGSHVRSGAKVMKARGRLKTYYFARSVGEAAEHVARYGPVVLGTVWTEGMKKPSYFGHVIKPTGKVIGGHAYLWLGVDGRFATIRNSWGTDWGEGGCARISLPDLEALWQSGAEACAASELDLPIYP